MRLKLFHRIPYSWATLFAAALCVVQLLQHTTLVFSVFTFTFILLAAAAFNVADGLTTLPGTYILANALLTFILGAVIKAAVSEPAQTGLRNGEESLGVYILGMLGMLIAVIVEKSFRARRPLLATTLRIPDLRTAYVGCALIGIFGDLYVTFIPAPPPGSFQALFWHLDYFTPLAIILGTIHTVQVSGGRRNLSLLLGLLILFGTAQGLLSFSKQGIFSPAVAWLLGMVGARYRLKWTDVLVLAGVVFLMVQFGIPWSQWGRSERAKDGAAVAEVIPTAIYLAEHFDLVREGYEADNSGPQEAIWHWYQHDVGQLDRMNMISIDDALIDYTDQHSPFGLRPIVEGFESLVPHLLWKNKPDPFYGNLFARELGGNPYDTSTGISMGPTGEAYREGGILGVLVLEPLVLTILFLVFSYVLGPVTSNPVNLVMVLYLLHIAPEGGLTTLIGGMSILWAILFVAVVARYTSLSILPMLARSKRDGSIHKAGPRRAGTGVTGRRVWDGVTR